MFLIKIEKSQTKRKATKTEMTAMTLIAKYKPGIQRSCIHLQACVLNLDVPHIKELSVCDQNAFKPDSPSKHAHSDGQFKPDTAYALMSDSGLNGQWLLNSNQRTEFEFI